MRTVCSWFSLHGRSKAPPSAFGSGHVPVSEERIRTQGEMLLGGTWSTILDRTAIASAAEFPAYGSLANEGSTT